MSKTSQILAVYHDEPKLKLSSYISGFVLSVVFTLAAYLLVVNHAASRDTLLGLVVAFALTQFLVQAIFFLHLAQESKPRWRLGIFIFMLGVVMIIVFGSMWIIFNLNYRQTIPQELQYVNSQDDL
ncbi:MAG TPA: cytochrome o ubiquinol oxidase subunit IV [Candidatus Saccharimonadales bacterium]|jgi:cytochrome o ubiquinol oxidase operon protein cyoD